MTRGQRVVLIVYCLLVVYCCVWVPWHITVAPATAGSSNQRRVGYGWLWAGPIPSAPVYSDVPPGYKLLSPISDRGGSLATPDLAVIILRVSAVTALAGAGLAAARY